MADEDTEDTTEQQPQGPSVVKWAVAGFLAIFLALVGAQVTGPIVANMLAPGPETDEEMAEDGEAEEEVDLTDLDPAIYVPLEPPLLASFEGADGQTRYLQMSVQAMGRSQAAMDAVRNHAPAIRNAFLFLMSEYSFEDIATAEGKERLRTDMRRAAQDILRRNTGDPGIEEIYFTSLVVQ
ncbi:MAG: flagellar basal body-associated FliL family protein [Gammaproteobacteria bacterium]|nr:flagellar basal body-associated FliL family protein [Gammaproteobacteria bacterium]